MPEQNEQPAPETPAPEPDAPPTPSSAPETRAEAPVVSFSKWVGRGVQTVLKGVFVTAPLAVGKEIQTIEEKISGTAFGIVDKVHEAIKPGFDEPKPVEATTLDNFAQQVAELPKDILNGSVHNVRRRFSETLDNSINLAKEAYSTVKKPIFNPIDTFSHPVDYIGERIGTLWKGAKNLAKKLVNAAPVALDEAVSRGIDRPIQRIPVAKETVGLLSGLAIKITGGVRKLVDGLTSFLNTEEETAA